jgi:hypothetical protein
MDSGLSIWKFVDSWFDAVGGVLMGKEQSQQIQKA